MDAGIFSGTGRDFRGEQAENEAVFVGAPDFAVFAQKTGPGTFLTAEVTRTVKQAWCEPFEADRDLPEFAIEAGDYTIDEATAD